MTVIVDSDDILWLGTRNKGLCRYDKAADKFKIYSHNPYNINSISSNNILTIIESSLNNIKYFWIGTDGGGLCKFFPGSGAFINYRSIDNKPNTLCNNHVYTLLEYDSEHLLIGTSGSNHCGGLDLFNQRTKMATWCWRMKPSSKRSPIHSFSRMVLEKRIVLLQRSASRTSSLSTLMMFYLFPAVIAQGR